MEFVFFSGAVLCSAAFAVMFRLCGKWKVDIGIAMAANYITGAALCCGEAGGSMEPWAWAIAVAVGIMYAGGFLVTEMCTRSCGVALTTVSARASFVLPVLLSWISIGDEQPSWVIFAMVLAAMFMITKPGKGHADWSLLPVFAVYGLANYLLRLLRWLDAGSGMATFVIFFSAMVISAGLCFRGKRENILRSAGAGLLMGIANSGTTFMILQSLRTIPGTVFYPAYNAAVVLVCTAVAITAFRERPDRIQWVGIILAAAAICINYLV